MFKKYVTRRHPRSSTMKRATTATPAGSGNPGTQTPAQGQPPQGQPPQGQPPQPPQGQPQPGGAAGEQERTFSQADVDRLMGERAARARQAAVNELLQELEIENLDTLRGTVQAQRQAQEAQMTELQKAQRRIQELDEERKRLAAENRTRVIETEVITAATALGFRNPRDGMALADLTAVAVGDDGKVTGVEEALKALLEARPYLKAEATPSPAPNIDAQRGAGITGAGQPPTYQHLLPPALRGRGQQK